MIGVIILLNVRCYDGWAAVVRVLDGWVVVLRVLLWLDCGGEGTTMVGLCWCGYYDSWAGVVRLVRWLGSSG